MAKSADYGLGRFAYPRGWFMVAEAAELSAGPVAARFFGRDFVLYRGSRGRAVMLDAHCPHKGAHLAHGVSSCMDVVGQRIEGDSIRCPFHGWRFAPDGRCDDIPYAADIPAEAQLKSWKVSEWAGAIFAWHDPENGEPDYELPPIPEWDDRLWIRGAFDRLGPLDCHPQELVDNMADLAHFPPVHGSAESCAYFWNEIHGVTLTMRYGAGHRTLAAKGEVLDSDVAYTGPGLLMSRQAGRRRSVQIITHTPVEDGTVRIWHRLLVKCAGRISTDDDVVAAREFQTANLRAFTQDFEIWSHKKAALTILQIPTDGPFHTIRRWYGQFFNPRALVPQLLSGVEGIHILRGSPSVSP